MIDIVESMEIGVILMNVNDMVKRGWKTRRIVDIVSHFNGEERRSDGWQVIAYDIPEGNIATYFPESNVLVPLNSTAKIQHANLKMDYLQPSRTRSRIIRGGMSLD